MYSNSIYGWGTGAALVYQNRNNDRYPMRGGANNESMCGSFFIYVDGVSSRTSWPFGAALSYKPAA